MHTRGNLRRFKIIDSIDEINKILEHCDELDLRRFNWGLQSDVKTDPIIDRRSGYKSLYGDYIVHETTTTLEVSTVYHDNHKPTTYKFALNKQDLEQMSGQQAFMQFSKYYSLPDLRRDDDWKRILHFTEDRSSFKLGAKQIVGCKYKGKNEFNNIYEYDLNSAFAATLYNKIPDFEHPYYEQQLKENQVGFLIDDELTMVTSGYADVSYDLISSPDSLRQFIDNWYTIKKTTKSVSEKKKAKDMLNMPIGYAQRVNPFFRSYVISKVNAFIRELVKAYPSIIMWNTDAVFSTEPLDLDIGSDLGQFKLVKINRLRCDGLTYQADDDIPVYRGIPKMWFEAFAAEHGRPFNLLTDIVPERNNVYYYDISMNRVRIAEWAKEKI